MSNNMTLVIMAAGLGSRFKGEVKQLSEVGPNGETIMDYSIKGAIEAGFNKVIFIIRDDIEEEFKEKIGNRVEKIIHVEYLFQDVKDVPLKYSHINRIKPWGTVHTLLTCRDVIKEPFCVINADDFYGKSAFKDIYYYLKANDNANQFCMSGYILKNTMSANGGVNRGICKIDHQNRLVDIEEVKGIKQEGDHAIGIYQDKQVELSLDSYVSMNLWGFKPSIFSLLEREFNLFLENYKDDEECCLSTIIDNLIKNNDIQVTLIKTDEKWFGMTFIEDKESVKQEIKKLIDIGIYKNDLYS